MSKGINIIFESPLDNPHCRICVNSKLILYDSDELVYKCKLCGSLFKYNKPIKKAMFGIDPELDNINNGKILFYKPPKKTENKVLPEVGNEHIQVKYIKDVTPSQRKTIRD